MKAKNFFKNGNQLYPGIKPSEKGDCYVYCEFCKIHIKLDGGRVIQRHIQCLRHMRANGTKNFPAGLYLLEFFI